MEAHLVIALSFLALVAPACAAAPHPASSPAPLTRLFGPVIGQQPIRGREEGDGVIVLLVDNMLVRVDVDERRATSTPIGLDSGQMCWGLGRLADGSLWTLRGRFSAVSIDARGRPSRAIELSEPHAGLFAAGARLIYQKAVSTAGEPVLRAAPPGGDWTTWSDLRARRFPGIDRAQASALNLVACGRSRTAERACWFPDEAAVALVDADGRTRRVALTGLDAIAPEVLLTAENPRRPIRDVYIDDERRIWVLSSGEPGAGAADVPGGWLLARYAPDGTPDGQTRLAEPARLILRIDRSRVILLAGSGDVSEVASW